MMERGRTTSGNSGNGSVKSGGSGFSLGMPPQVRHQQHLFFALFLLLLQCYRSVDAQLGIPGVTATKSGYDTEFGKDAICWRSFADRTPTANVSLPNPLVANFKLLDKVELLRECPEGNSLRTQPSLEMLEQQEEERLRTHRIYNYTVDIALNLDSLDANHLVSDWGARVAVQIVVCSLGDSGFCSPFIHEESNERLYKLGLPLEPEPGYRHGGSHVHSPYKFVDLNPSEGPRYNVSLQIPMLVNEPGSYFAIAAVQLMVADSEFIPAEIRYDMANAMDRNDQRIVHYQDPPVILQVPKGVKVTSYVVIGISGLILLYLLIETVRHRAHKVIQLTQGPFLILFLIMALAATTSSVLFEHTNDVCCQSSYPIFLICLQCMYAITLGRLWRITSVISPLLVHTVAGRPERHTNRLTVRNCMEKAGNKLMEFTTLVAFVGSTDNRCGTRRSKGLRVTITDWHLARVVVFFTLPQVVMQVLSVTLQPRRHVILFNPDQSIGRSTCRADVPANQSILYYSCYVFLLLLVTLLVMAAGTRKLPSLFSETQDILDSAVSSVVLLVLGVAILLVVAGEPTVSPGVHYLVWVFMALSLCLNLSLRIVLPKLQMVWRGEVVLVSQLVSDHKSRLNSRSMMYAAQKAAVFVSGIQVSSMEDRDPSASNAPGISAAEGGDCSAAVDEVDEDKCVGSHAGPLIKGGTEGGGEKEENTSSCNVDDVQRLICRGTAQDPEQRLRQRTAKPQRRVVVQENNDRQQPQPAPILISTDKSPAKGLVLTMVDAQEQLAAINERIMSGRCVPKDDWERTRRVAGRLCDTLRNEVLFSWEATPATGASSSAVEESASGVPLATTNSTRSLQQLMANKTSSTDSDGNNNEDQDVLEKL